MSIPGMDAVEAEVTPDGRVLLKFKDGSVKEPFIARYVSDGTIKMFAYLVLLYDPKPHPFEHLPHTHLQDCRINAL